jgi:hypothetical protein
VRKYDAKNVPEHVKPEQDLNTLLKKLINKYPVMIFIKGTPLTPRCGFTRQLVQLFDSKAIQYGYFDILSNNDVREGKNATWLLFKVLKCIPTGQRFHKSTLMVSL